MAFFKGERFNVDLDFDNENDPSPNPGKKSPNPAFDFLDDIKERTTSTQNPAVAPSFKDTPSGFPPHKKRTRLSAFKQERLHQQASRSEGKHNHTTDGATRSLLAANDDTKSWEESQKKQIDDENKQKLAEMTPTEIERERQELFSTLNPSLIQKLLQRASIDDEPQFHPSETLPVNSEAGPARQKPKSSKTVTFQGTRDLSSSRSNQLESSSDMENSPEPPPHPSFANEALLETPIPASGSIHFPRPLAAPALDPSSPSFLNDLHSRYFPDLPHDPAKLTWMTDASNNNTSSPYHPSQQAIEASEVRFNFRGQLIPPSVAQEIPVTEGLHHHGDAPEAAGYTIPELARLARSAVPAQRCIAIQTLGRMLYRLGIGEFGDETERGDAEARTGRLITDEGYDDDEKSAAAELAKGLWECVETGRVIETLEEEANKQKGHLTSITLAKEALWNWQRGGGRRRRAI